MNQCITEYRGVSTWSDFPYELHNLDTNYRNTNQITTYCNQKFKTNLRKVGLNGSPVKETDEHTALKTILDLQVTNPDWRTVIISSQNTSQVLNAVHEIIPNENLIIKNFESGKISLVILDFIKGMEFEAVLVWSENMTDNEKYVAFTRANAFGFH